MAWTSNLPVKVLMSFVVDPSELIRCLLTSHFTEARGQCCRCDGHSPFGFKTPDVLHHLVDPAERERKRGPVHKLAAHDFLGDVANDDLGPANDAGSHRQ